MVKGITLNELRVAVLELAAPNLNFELDCTVVGRVAHDQSGVPLISLFTSFI